MPRLCLARRIGPFLALTLAFLAFAFPARSTPVVNHPGKWTPKSAPWPAIAVHMILLRDTLDTHGESRIVWWNSEDDSIFFGGMWKWKPNTSDDCSSFPSTGYFDSVTLAKPGGSGTVYDPFCGAHAQTANGKLLVVGGTEHGEVGVTTTQVYDPNTNTWSGTTDMTNARWYGTATALPSGKALATSGSRYDHLLEFGGHLAASGASDDTVRRLGMPLAGHWDSPVPPATVGLDWPAAREGHTFTGRLVACGYNPSLPQPFLADVWQVSRALQPFSTDYAYTFASLPITTFWQTFGRRADHVAVELDNSAVGGADLGLLIHGGRNSGGTLLSAARLVPDGGNWKWVQLTTSGTDTPGARFGHVAMYDPYHHRMLVFGGTNAARTAPSDTVIYALDLHDPTSTCAWSKVPVSAASGRPSARVGAAMAVDPRVLTRAVVSDTYNQVKTGIAAYLMGGQTGTDSSSVVGDIWQLWIPSDSTQTWVEWVPLSPDSSAYAPTARARAAVSYDPTSQRIVFVGGEAASGVTGREVYGLDLGFHQRDIIPSTWHYSWQRLQDLPGAGFSRGAVDFTDHVYVRDAEIADLSGGSASWSSAGLAPHLDPWYPFMFVTPSGKLFDAGSGNSGDPTTSMADLSAGTWAAYPSVDTTDFQAGSAAMYLPGLVMKTGSREIAPGANAITTTRQIDLTESAPQWRPSANSMTYGRINHNLVILPDGEVLVVGGTMSVPSDSTTFFNAGGRRPELWDPTYSNSTGRGYWYMTTSTGDSLAQCPLPRDYHGTAILLPDGRVLQAGGNSVGQVEPFDLEAEMYCPPYLFTPSGSLAPRPAIEPTLGPPDKIAYGQVFHLATTVTTNPSAVDSVVLIKPGAATHGFDQDQRFLRLATTHCSSDSTILEITAPANANLAPPGDYLLFLVYRRDASHSFYGTPSVARWVRIGSITGAENIGCGGGGGCPFADLETVDGWKTENSILGRSLAGSLLLDTYGLRATPAVSNGVLNLRLRENEQEVTTLDRVRLAVVDHPAGTELFAGDSGPVIGTRVGAYRVTTRTGDDVTALVTHGGSLGYDGVAGDTLYAEMDPPSAGQYALSATMDGGDSGLIGAHSKDVELRFDPNTKSMRGAASPAGSTSSADSRWLGQSGILIQGPDGTGGWRDLRHMYPREYTNEQALDSTAHGQLRFVFLAHHHLTYVGRIQPSADGGVVSTVTPRSAVHSRLGDVTTTLATTGETTTLVTGDTISVSFAIPAPIEGKVRNYLLLSDGVYTTPAVPGRQDLLGSAVPLRFALGQNTPNPFRGTTRIAFDVPHAAPVTLEIFDLSGRRVRTLSSAVWPAGRHEIEWDRRSGSGGTVHAGVYLYRMRAPAFTDHRKLVVTGE